MRIFIICNKEESQIVGRIYVIVFCYTVLSITCDVYIWNRDIVILLRKTIKTDAYIVGRID